MSGDLAALVLAGGKPVRPLLGTTTLRLVLSAVRGTHPGRIWIAAGADEEATKAEAAACGAVLIDPNAGRRTREAVRAFDKSAGKKGGDILVVPADLPLLRPAALKALIARHRRKGGSLTFLRPEPDFAPGSGHPRRGAGKPHRVGPGVCVFRAGDLARALRRTDDLSEAGGILAAEGLPVGVMTAARPEDLVPVRTPRDLSRAMEALRKRKLDALARAGVTILNPAATWIDLAATIGRGTVVYPSVVVEGPSRIGRRCRLLPGVHLADARLGDDVEVLSATVIDGAVVEGASRIGPFARLRPGTRIRRGAHVGNFVELKNTDLGRGSKAMHLTYLGDSEVGAGVNVGAGTITCNYDGVRKSRTVIEAGAFIGSGTELIAPVKIGRGAYIAAGSTITKDVSPDALAIARTRQAERPGWAKSRREKLGRG